MKQRIKIEKPEHYLYTVFDNNDRQRLTPIIRFDKDVVEVDLTKFGEIKGNWHILIQEQVIK